MPMASELWLASSPARSNSSRMVSMYVGVTMMTRGRRSQMSLTCRPVMPPEAGITVQPSRSAP
jgi:hypothetical protein